MATDWDAIIAATEQKIVETKAALTAFMKTAEGKKLIELREAAAATQTAYSLAGDALREAEREAQVRLGLYRDAMVVIDGGGTRAKRRIFTEEFKAAVAAQVGLSYAEAEELGLTGLSSFHGYRVTGTELYHKVLGRFADCIIDADAEVRAAATKRDTAFKVKQAAETKLADAQREHREVLRGPDDAEYELRRHRDSKTLAEQARQVAAERKQLVVKKDPKVAARLAAAKEKLLALDEKHSETPGRYGAPPKPGAPITWWPPPAESKRSAR
jgi:hypothetical protein